MNPIEEFHKRNADLTSRAAADPDLREATRRWMEMATPYEYTYHFACLGRPIIQYPQDIVAMQELIWRTRPDLIIETGIAHGGSLVMSASMLALLDYCDAVAAGSVLDPARPRRRVLGIDIEIRAHNRVAIESHPMAHRIDMIEGSSIDPSVVEQVRAAASGRERVLVCLDSSHTHEHVLAELEAYAPLTTPGSYCCVFDTVVEDLSGELFANRPWGKGDNPKTAVHEYLGRLSAEGRKALDGEALHLEIDHSIQDKLLITMAPDGYLKRPAR